MPDIDWHYPARERLAQLPTPLDLLPRATERWGRGRKIWCKRDDLTGALLTGNKVRKLEFIAAEARARGCHGLITAGALQSNHCRATAAVAAQLGMKCELLLRSDGDELSGNYLLSELLNAEINFVSKRTTGDEMSEHLAEAESRWAARGDKAMVIPIGGSDEVGIWGYIAAVEELNNDMRVLGIDRALIVHATGSGGTQAGLNAGVALHQCPAQVLSYAVCDDEAYFVDKAKADWGNAQRAYPQLPALEIAAETNDAYIGPGYGRADAEVFDAIAELAALEGVVLDPVYTGKAFHGLISDIANGALASDVGDIIFVHTGGVFGIFPHVDSISRSVEKRR